MNTLPAGEVAISGWTPFGVEHADSKPGTWSLDPDHENILSPVYNKEVQKTYRYVGWSQVRNVSYDSTYRFNEPFKNALCGWRF